MNKILALIVAVLAVLFTWAILFFFNLSLNIAWALAGVPVAIVIAIVWGQLKELVPNPYGARLYRIRDEYGFWGLQQGKEVMGLFAPGDMVLILPSEPGSADVHKGLVHIGEPYDGRELWLPPRLIEPVSNLAAWWHHNRIAEREVVQRE